MNKIRKVEIVFKGELFLDTFFYLLEKVSEPKQENRIFSRKGLTKKIWEIMEMTSQNTKLPTKITQNNLLQAENCLFRRFFLPLGA